MNRTESPAYLAQLLRDYAASAGPVLRYALLKLADRIALIRINRPEK